VLAPMGGGSLAFGSDEVLQMMIKSSLIKQTNKLSVLLHYYFERRVKTALLLKVGVGTVLPRLEQWPYPQQIHLSKKNKKKQFYLRCTNKPTNKQSVGVKPYKP
jgi:hypothetical protein